MAEVTPSDSTGGGGGPGQPIPTGLTASGTQRGGGTLTLSITFSSTPTGSTPSPQLNCDSNEIWPVNGNGTQGQWPYSVTPNTGGSVTNLTVGYGSVTTSTTVTVSINGTNCQVGIPLTA